MFIKNLKSPKSSQRLFFWKTETALNIPFKDEEVFFYVSYDLVSWTDTNVLNSFVQDNI